MMNFENLKKNTTAIIAIIILTLSYAILFSIIFWDFPTDQKDIYFTIAGGVTSIVTMIVSYYFGSKNKSVSDNARVFHHLVGTFCFISALLALVNNYFSFYSFSEAGMNLELNIYFIILMIIGLLLNLKSRGKI